MTENLSRVLMPDISQHNGSVSMRTLKAAMIGASMVSTIGCTTLDVYFDKAVEIDGEAYYFNDAGEIEMSSEKLAELQDNKKVLRIKHVSKTDALILDPEELTVLMQDQEVFFSNLDNNPLKEEQSFVLAKGSLKSNLLRLAKEAGWETIQWDGVHNYYIESPQVIIGEDFLSIAIEIISQYPLTGIFDNEIKQLKISAAK